MADPTLTPPNFAPDADLPKPPFVDVPGIFNFRDIGDGKVVRMGWVFRSADPTKATPEGLEKMSKHLGIKRIFDLRSNRELQRNGPEWAGLTAENADPFAAHGITRQWTPVFTDEDYSPEEIAIRYKQYSEGGTEGFVAAYRTILEHGGNAYGSIFKYWAGERPGPCLVHCTAGKDRTGILIALLFMLVGIDKHKIAEEYSLTTLGLAPLKPVFEERLLKHPALNADRQSALNMMSSKAENMIASIEMIEKEFGGAEKYLQEYCRLTEEEVANVKTNLKHPMTPSI